MLKNPLYVGMVTFNGEHFPGAHEPIVAPDVWEQACQLRQARTAQGRPRGRRTAGRHLLTEGLLRCPCGAAMSPVTKRDKRARNGIYETYQCVKRLHHGPSACAQKPIRRAAVDGAIYDYFETVVLDVDATRAVVAAHAAHELADTEALRHQAEQEAAKAESALARVERDYLDGKLSVEKWERFEARLTGELEGARAQIEQHDRKRAAIDAQVAEIDAQATVAEELGGATPNGGRRSQSGP